MFQQITKGIKISVKTKYNGTRYRGHTTYYAFSYFISIENYSSQTVQLLERFWVIFDSLNNVEEVNGKGVVGQTPTLKPREVYNYQSHCFLVSSIGAMSGRYKMIDTSSLEEFFVTIPTFQLTTTPRLN
ncbi:Co2+/Mg2+ efflux protein ApaG [Tenacibaculum xiamenense]|uniref:Co2+/Mg2+ efflux protein ApaG n=1 Tax=Tenacibaculum xiamenense TaxID=1261553 RepID=UPI003896355F